ncbi:TIGR03086 family metal-binding protein [Nocardia veterana]|uniref:TIGR03086 family protein n=1 Tax=Nocardia veterana TaxID=132249 RepID=A0A7X6RL61_9NOCA|nr:TIGR03086 family metal-binding protein [Nocardia veterana]NKY89900.1 TIGR03086 family protein [Nocardia veterana]
MNATSIAPAAALAPVWREVLADAHRALADVVAGIGTAELELPTPCSQWTVAQVVQHAAGDQLAYAAALGVGTGPAYDPFAPSGVLDRAGAAALVSDAVDRTAAAWATVSEDTESVPTPLPHGALPTPVAAVMCALDAAVHAWDIAVATGRPSPLGERMATHLRTAATGLIEPLRQWGAYADVVPAQPGDDAVAALLRYLGRNPSA